MKRARNMVIGLLLAAGSLQACAGLTVQRQAFPPVGKINGLAVNHNLPHHVVAVFRQRPGAGQIITRQATAMLPSQQEFYVVGYNSGLFSTRELTVELNTDSTIKMVDFDSKSTLADDLGKMAKAVDSVTKLRKDIQAEQEKKEQEKAAEDDVQMRKELLRLMLEANMEAARTGQKLPYTIPSR